ncbi:hypothetical protein LF1_00460 [Rubripirellula obstinata]|uniref:Uncharacterized protein n=1 Tax=Rubripirellula obstinata TaxID=406547 RepID=A0A5B1CCV8_9BACT|nr:hypothetical protein LF1_00460 [Rubripirellula obstinata]
MIVTYVDEVRADGRHRNGVLRITIACTGVAAAHFSLCLHVKTRHLGDAYRYPTEPRTLAARLAPCGAQPTHGQYRFAPTLTQYSSADCPAGHQPTPEFQYSINADVPDALRGTNQRLYSRTRYTASHRNLLCRRHSVTLSARRLSPTWTKSALTDRIAMVHYG